jgi:hypothetical protein
VSEKIRLHFVDPDLGKSVSLWYDGDDRDDRDAAHRKLCEMQARGVDVKVKRVDSDDN